MTLSAIRISVLAAERRAEVLAAEPEAADDRAAAPDREQQPAGLRQPARVRVRRDRDLEHAERGRLQHRDEQHDPQPAAGQRSDQPRATGSRGPAPTAIGRT